MKISMQKGFSLVTAIFLLVVLASLMGYMVNLRIVQQSTIVMSAQGASAFQAARAGLEYGIFQALNNATCNAGNTLTFTSADLSLSPFIVDLSCSLSTHVEGVRQVNVYELSANASRGNYILGADVNPDYVSRLIKVTLSNEPP